MNLQGQTLEEELAADRSAASRPTYFYIDPNQFDGEDDKSEKAAFDSCVDVVLTDVEFAKSTAQRLANAVGHRVVVTKITETSSLGREFEEVHTAHAGA